MPIQLKEKDKLLLNSLLLREMLMEMQFSQLIKKLMFFTELTRTEIKNKFVIFLNYLGAPLATADPIEAPLAFCTDDLKIIAIKISGVESTNPKVEIISYDSDDGSVSQTFTLNFIPVIKYATCNDNYLSLLDNNGTVHIFKYSHALPVWAIILIVVGSLLIIGGIVGFVIYKRRQSKKAGNYQQFDNEEKSRNGL